MHEFSPVDVGQRARDVHQRRKAMGQSEPLILLGSGNALALDVVEDQSQNASAGVLERAVTADQRRVTQADQHARLATQPLDVAAPTSVVSTSFSARQASRSTESMTFHTLPCPPTPSGSTSS